MFRCHVHLALSLFLTHYPLTCLLWLWSIYDHISDSSHFFCVLNLSITYRFFISSFYGCVFLFLHSVAVCKLCVFRTLVRPSQPRPPHVFVSLCSLYTTHTCYDSSRWFLFFFSSLCVCAFFFHHLFVQYNHVHSVHTVL